MLSLRLGWRLLRGGGRGGLTRLALTTLGVLVGVLALLLATALPRLTAAQTVREGERLPVGLPVDAAEGDAGSFAFQDLEDQLDGRRWQHVLFSGPADAPAPPGLARLPQPGEVWRSPGLQKLLTQTGSAGPAPTGLIDDAGLTDPDELLNYVGVTKDGLGVFAAAGVGFGRGSQFVDDQVPRSRIVAQLILLIGLPAFAYLAVCAQLSAATRARRLAALRLIGVGSSTLVGAAVVEAAAAGLVGSVLGLALYPLVNTILARTGILGFTWFPQDAGLTAPLAVITLALVVGLSARAGLVGMRRVLARPLDARKEPDQRPGTWWGLIPLALGLAVIFPFAAFLLLHRTVVIEFTSALNLVAYATVFAVGGLLLTVRPAIRAFTRVLTRERFSLSVRLAARRLQVDTGSTLRVISGLVMLLLVAGIGPAILQDGKLAVGSQSDRPVVTVQNVGDPQQRTSLFGLDAQARIAIVPGEQNTTDPAAARPVVVADCASLRYLLDEALPSCADDAAFRLLTTDFDGTQIALAPGQAVRAPGLDAAPDPLLQIDTYGTLPDGALLLTRPVAGAELPPRTQFLFRTATVTGSDRLRAATRQIAPAAEPGSDLNVSAVRVYILLRGTTYLGMSVGFLLGLLAFLVATADRAVERRNNVAALVVVGLPLRTLRRAQTLQVLLPLAVALTMAGIVGNATGLAWLAAGGSQDGFYGTGLYVSLGLTGLALALAVVAGLFVPGKNPQVQHLRRE